MATDLVFLCLVIEQDTFSKPLLKGQRLGKFMSNASFPSTQTTDHSQERFEISQEKGLYLQTDLANPRYMVTLNSKV